MVLSTLSSLRFPLMMFPRVVSRGCAAHKHSRHIYVGDFSTFIALHLFVEMCHFVCQVGLLIESKVSIAKFMQAFEDVRAVFNLWVASNATFSLQIVVTFSSGSPSSQSIRQQASGSDSCSIVAVSSIGCRSRSSSCAYSVWVSFRLLRCGRCRVCNGAGVMCKFAWWRLTCDV